MNFRHGVLLLLCFAVTLAVGNRRNAKVVPNGTHIIRNETGVTLIEPNGRVRFDHLPADASAQQARDSGWIASVWTYADYTYYTATWNVPDLPAEYNGQTIFFFNSLEGTANDILQPVLQYNDGGGPSWFLAAWYGFANGQYYHSDPIAVNVGDVVRGIIQRSDDGTSWTISFHVNYAPSSATITVSSSSVGTQTVAQFALEVYGITDCIQYPGDEVLSVRSIEFKVGNTVVNPSWSPSVNPNNCQASASASGAEATIRWSVLDG